MPVTQRASWEDTTCNLPVRNDLTQTVPLGLNTRKLNTERCTAFSDEEHPLVMVYPRVNCVWVDIYNRYPALKDEPGRVLSLFPGCTRVIRVTGGGVPVGYRRWEVR